MSTASAIESLVARAQRGSVSRRNFVQGASALGLSAAIGRALAGRRRRTRRWTPFLPRFRARWRQDARRRHSAANRSARPRHRRRQWLRRHHSNPRQHQRRTHPLQIGTGEVEPALAESWSASEDGLTYTFTLRQGVTFHDGTPLNADAVVKNVKRQIDPKDPGYSDQFIYAGIVYQDVSDVAAASETEVTFTLSRPITLLPGNLAVFAGGVVSPTALETYADDYSQHAAGTGPFKLDAFTPDVELSLVANDEYWGGRPALDRVVFRTISEIPFAFRS